jgi:uncharacterized membrane protein YeaQ/YmgE (transglycosylase-associated protein family)
MMNPLIWLVVGALLGFLACVELGPARPRYRIANVLAGACGAFFAGWSLSTALGPDITAVGDLSVGNLIGAAFGAVVLLVLVNLVRLIRMP